MTTVLVALVLGVAAGVVAGMFGVGGGTLFVPALLALGLSQIEAEATSLMAILPAVVAGTWRQTAYGNVLWRTAAVIGVSALPGVVAGIWIAESVREDVLRRLFALLMLGVAAQLAWRSLRGGPSRLRRDSHSGVTRPGGGQGQTPPPREDT